MRQSSRQIGNRLCRASLAFLCLHASTASSWAAEQLIDEEAIPKWKAYERFSRSLQGTARKSIVRDSGQEERTQIVYKQNQNCLSRCIWDQQKPTEYCQFANARYAAGLHRSQSNPSDAVLDRFTEDPHGPFPGTTQSVFDTVFPEIAPHFFIGTTPLSQTVVDPRFKILKVSKISEKGRELVQLAFHVVREYSKDGMRSEVSGLSILDPARCWCVLRSKGATTVTMKGRHTMDTESESEFEMVDDPSGFPLVKTKISRGTRHAYASKEEKHTFRSRIDYEWEVNDHVLDSEFTLTAFGLPEPGGEEPVKNPIPIYIWILVAAGVSATLAWGFRYLIHRARLKPSA